MIAFIYQKRYNFFSVTTNFGKIKQVGFQTFNFVQFSSNFLIFIDVIQI